MTLSWWDKKNSMGNTHQVRVVMKSIRKDGEQHFQVWMDFLC